MKKIEFADQPRIDYAAEIRERVSMTDIVTHYVGTPIQNRIACPFHHGKDRNMAVYASGYKCYVCGESGDQVRFVQKLFGLDFMGAAERLNEDFRLGLPLRGSGAIDPALLREAAERAAKRRREELERREREEDAALFRDIWALCDRALREADPNSRAYELAAKNIDWVSHLIDMSEEEEWRSRASSPRDTP